MKAGPSYWMTTAPGPEHAPLTEDISVDVAVVGGGVAGLSVAAELARTGRSVAVLDAGRVAAGVTGYTTAKLSPQHGAIYDHLERHLGADAAASYAADQQRAMRHVVATAERLGVDCELETRPSFVWSEDEGDVPTLRAEAAAAARAGLDAAFVTTGLPFPVSGAVRVEDQLTFHPRKYLLALAEELVRDGGRIFEQTRVTDLHEGEPCVLTCAGGQKVSALDVVVATHYPVFDRSLLFPRMSVKREFAVAGRLPDRDEPEGMAVSLDSDVRSIRTAPYDGGRLLIVTGAPFTPGDGSARDQLAALVSWTGRRFPEVELTQAWATQDLTSGDRVPFVGPLHAGARHAWVMTAFGGWGMTNGVAAGLLLTDLITGGTPPSAGLYDPRRVHPLLEAATVARTGAKTVAHWVGDRVRAGVAGTRTVDDLGPGEAAIVSDGDGRWATYVDDSGVPHSVSAACTHMGCLVAFNDAERAWECPCHGSRFALDGSVLQGPATQPLACRRGDAQGSEGHA